MNIKISNKLQKYFESDSTLKKRYQKLYDSIKLNYSLLKLSNNLGEIPNTPPTRRHKLEGNFKDCWSLTLNKNWRMIIKNLSGTNDVNLIDYVEIIDIVDYH